MQDGARSPSCITASSMHLLVQTLIQGIVGFAIGAGTNDLAIRWVFRAIFAKKKPQIATAVQRVISHELMTPDKIAAHLASPEVITTLEKDLAALLDELAAKSYPSLDTLLKGTADQTVLNAAETTLAASLTEAAYRQLASDTFRATTLHQFANELWAAFAPKSPREILPACAEAALKALPQRLVASLFSEGQRDALIEALADGIEVWTRAYPTPAALLGAANAALAAKLVASRARFLVNELALVLATADAQKLLSDAIACAVRRRLTAAGMLGSLFSGLVGFAPVEEQLQKFCATIPDALREQFAQPSEETRLGQMVEGVLNRLAAKPWNELFDFSNPQKLRQLLREALAEPSIRPLLEQGANRLVEVLDESLQDVPLNTLAARTLGADGINSWMNAAIETAYRALTAPEVRTKLGQEAQTFLHQLRSVPIEKPDRFFPEAARARLAKGFAQQVSVFVRDHTGELLERSHFWDVVYDSITVYDEHKMEAITRSIANHELIGVTLMGGVIGFLVGIAQGVFLWLVDKF